MKPNLSFDTTFLTKRWHVQPAKHDVSAQRARSPLLRFIPILFLLPFSDCLADPSEKTPEQDQVEHTGAFVPLAGETPTPSPTPAPTPRTFYTLYPVSVTTDVGISGIAPGTRLILIEERMEGHYVTDGKNKFLISKEAVSTDARKAASLRSEFLKAQASIQEKVKREREKADEAERERRAKMKGMVD